MMCVASTITINQGELSIREGKKNLAKEALGRISTSQARTADEEEQQLSGVHFL
jgi:hypothetical protein